jgi:hypothetical protein
MRFLKHAVLMASLLFSAVAMLSILSLRNFPVHSGGGGANAPSGNGDVNCDGRIDISDPVYTLSWLFIGGPEPCAIAQDPGDCCPEIVEALGKIAEAIQDPCLKRIGRFIDNGDGTITDPCTGLMWKQTHLAYDIDLDSIPDSSFNWMQLTNLLGQGYEFAGHSDWRLPTVREFESIINTFSGHPDMYFEVPHFRYINGVEYWTSTEEGAEGAYMAKPDFDNSVVNSHSKSERFKALLVRGPINL